MIAEGIHKRLPSNVKCQLTVAISKMSSGIPESIQWGVMTIVQMVAPIISVRDPERSTATCPETYVLYERIINTDLRGEDALLCSRRLQRPCGYVSL